MPRSPPFSAMMQPRNVVSHSFLSIFPIMSPMALRVLPCKKSKKYCFHFELLGIFDNLTICMGRSKANLGHKAQMCENGKITV